RRRSTASAGSQPSRGYNGRPLGVFPSGQRGRAVNPLALPSEVRILPPPLRRKVRSRASVTTLRRSAVPLTALGRGRRVGRGGGTDDGSARRVPALRRRLRR